MARPHTSTLPAPAWDAPGQPSLRAARRAVIGATANLTFHVEAARLAPEEIRKLVAELVAVLETHRDVLVVQAMARAASS